MYKPLIFKLNQGDSSVLDNAPTKDDLILSSTINMPLYSLGFHSFLHRTKNAMSITNNLQTKNKFYYIVNPFEHVVPNYEDSLKNLTKEYLNLKDESPDILSPSLPSRREKDHKGSRRTCAQRQRNQTKPSRFHD